MSDKTLTALEYDKVLEDISIYTKSDLSKNLCINLKPFELTADIKYELQCTKEAVEILNYGNDIPIEFICDTKLLKTRTEYFYPEEFVSIAKTIRTSRLVKNFLKENCNQFDNLLQTSSMLYSNKPLEEKIFSSFDDKSQINPSVTPELKRLNTSLKDSETNLKAKINELLNNPEFSKHLQEQIYTQRDDRIVFQVRASSKSKIQGIIHDVSATSKSFYIEPAQIIPLGNKIREIKSKINIEIVKFLTALTKELNKDINEIINSIELSAKIDLCFAKARYAVKTKSVFPELSADKQIKIIEMRHPLLIGRTENLVANDFFIGGDYNSVIITGSNTGGKTVALKTIGLFVLMIKSGLFLPCTEAKIFPFDKIFADIGDEQNILQNLSTFSSHMKSLVEIIKTATENSLVLIDEICAGTDPVEGAVLAEVLLKKLSSKSIFTIVTTHYGQLKSLEFTDKSFKNGCVDFDMQTLQPTYKLVIGMPGVSNAIAISANLGLDSELIASATDILNSRKDSSGILLENLQNTQHELSKELQIAKKTSEEVTELKLYYDNELKEIKKERKKTLKQIKTRFDNDLEIIKSEMKEAVNDLRKEKTEKIARRSYTRIAKIETDFREKIDELHGLNDYYEEIDWNLPPTILSGSKALLKELNQEVTIITAPDKNGSVKIQMGMIYTKVKKERLAVYDKSLTKVTKLPVYLQQSDTSVTRESGAKIYRDNTLSNNLDLRGLRVEDGLDKLEAYLDKASLQNLTPVHIIHGHGTGAMKSAVREFLSTSPYVKEYRVGESAEGGDGVSIVDLK